MREPLAEKREVFRFERHLSDRIAGEGVETGRDEKQIGPKLEQSGQSLSTASRCLRARYGRTVKL